MPRNSDRRYTPSWLLAWLAAWRPAFTSSEDPAPDLRGRRLVSVTPQCHKPEVMFEALQGCLTTEIYENLRKGQRIAARKAAQSADEESKTAPGGDRRRKLASAHLAIAAVEGQVKRYEVESGTAWARIEATLTLGQKPPLDLVVVLRAADTPSTAVLALCSCPTTSSRRDADGEADAPMHGSWDLTWKAAAGEAPLIRGQQVQVTVLASLLPSIRTYDALQVALSTPAIGDRTVPEWYYDSWKPTATFTLPPVGIPPPEVQRLASFKSLNASQQTAVKRIYGLESGVMIIQGPPGAGKTTTLRPVLLGRLMTTGGGVDILTGHSNQSVLANMDGLLSALKRMKRMDLMQYVAYMAVTKTTVKVKHDWVIYNVARAIVEGAATVSAAMGKDVNQLCRSIKQLRKEVLGWSSAVLAFSSDQSCYLHCLTHHHTTCKTARAVAREAGELCTQLQQVLVPVQSGKAQRSRLATMKNKAAMLIRQIQHKMGELYTKLHELEITELEEKEVVKAITVHARLVMCTVVSSTAARSILQSPLGGIRRLILDEAGQCTEADLFIPLALRPKCMVLCGDVAQLPPTVLSSAAKRANYDRSMLYRLQRDLHAPVSLLNTQYRMHSTIMRASNAMFYGNRVKTGSTMDSRSFPAPKLAQYFRSGRVILHDTSDMFEDEKAGHEMSSRNSREAAAVVHEAAVLVQAYRDAGVEVSAADRQVVIITMYTNQRFAIEDLLEEEGLRAAVAVSTVDGFQGREADVVILSTVRSNADNSAGFLDEHRLNVALTRAKHGLVVFASTTLWKAQPTKSCLHKYTTVSGATVTPAVDPPTAPAGGSPGRGAGSGSGSGEAAVPRSFKRH